MILEMQYPISQFVSTTHINVHLSVTQLSLEVARENVVTPSRREGISGYTQMLRSVPALISVAWQNTGTQSLTISFLVPDG